MTKLTRSSLAAQAARLSGSIDDLRWEIAKLAAQAKAEKLPGWAEIIGSSLKCRRAADTVEHWARTWEWCAEWRVMTKVNRDKLTYSFFECAQKKSDFIDPDSLIELLQTYARSPGATYEAFRAQLSTLAGRPDYNSGEFPAWVKQERKRIADWIDRAPTKRSADCLMMADAALADALESETIHA